MQISAIIPCYNFDKKIKKNIILLNSILRKNFQNYEIIIINDASLDDTKNELEKIKKLRKIKKLTVIHNKHNKGKSYSIRKGIRKAVGEKIFLYDCDLPYRKYINQFFKKLKNNQFVIIDRKNKKSKLVRKNINFYQKIRYLIGITISFIVCLFLQVSIVDTQSGMKGFTNFKILKKKKFISERFFLDIEIMNLFKKNKIYPTKIPVKFEIPNNSTIRLFDIKNIKIIIELYQVLSSIRKY